MKSITHLKLLFVINPVSGGFDKEILKEGIRNYFYHTEYVILLIMLNGKSDVDLLKSHISSFTPDKVIAVGGDGTIKLVAQQLMGTNIALGILPAGSANGLATELGIPLRLNAALDIIISNSIKKIDLVLINEKEISIHLSDLGLNALLLRYYSKGSIRGKWAYARLFIPVLLRRRLFKTTLEYDGIKLNCSVFMIVLANARAYGTGLMINPLGEMGDGKFEVIIIREFSFWELLKMMFTHRPFDPNKTEVIQTSEVTITTRKKVFFQIDGEYLGKVTYVKARILPSAINLICPLRYS